MVKSNSADPSAVEQREAWLQRLDRLMKSVEAWARELDWSTREIEKKMEDSEIGTYKAPALLLQRETVRAIVEPITRKAVGADGVVDLYLLPAYDDIASLYFMEGKWRIHYVFPDRSAVAKVEEAKSRVLSKKELAQVLEAMMEHAV